MIRVTHGTEPPELARCRVRHLAKLEKAWQVVDATDPEAVERFRKERDKLFERDYRERSSDTLYERWQHKCAYCGAERNTSDPIDHFRPRRPEVGVHDGYWWLTWSWHNLLPACTTCNGAKGNGFPVEGQRLRPFEHDVARETAQLINPSREDPLEHLELAREETNGRERWTVQGKDARGRTTAKLLKLDEDDDRYQTHLETLRSFLKELGEQEQRGADHLRAFWQRKMRMYFPSIGAANAPMQPFPALTHAYVRHHFDDAMKRHGLELPALGDPSPAEPSTPSARPNPWGLDGELLRDIDALSGKPDKQATREVLLRLVAIRSWTLEELAGLLPQKAISLLNSHIRPLAKSGELEYEPRQRRIHPLSERDARQGSQADRSRRSR